MNPELLAGLTANPAFLYNLLAFVVGLAIHVGQKMFQHEISFREYVKDHGGRTLLSLTSLVGAFSGIAMLFPEATYLTYFFCGYSIDSMVNKAPISLKGAMNHLPLDKKLEMSDEQTK